MNQIEMVPCEHGVTVVLIDPEDVVTLQHMSWDEFTRLQRLLADGELNDEDRENAVE